MDTKKQPNTKSEVDKLINKFLETTINEIILVRLNYPRKDLSDSIILHVATLIRDSLAMRPNERYILTRCISHPIQSANPSMSVAMFELEDAGYVSNVIIRPHQFAVACTFKGYQLMAVKDVLTSNRPHLGYRVEIEELIAVLKAFNKHPFPKRTQRVEWCGPAITEHVKPPFPKSTMAIDSGGGGCGCGFWF